MNKKFLLRLILFVSLMAGGMFLTTELLINQSSRIDAGTKQVRVAPDNHTEDKSGNASTGADGTNKIEEATAGFATDTDKGKSANAADSSEPGSSDNGNASLRAYASTVSAPRLIIDSSRINYKKYIPSMTYDSELKAALDISNPDIAVDAKAAVLFDANTGKVLYYKNPVKAVFPASTLKLLTSLVALSRCSLDEKVTIGDEIKMIASDSTRAYLREGEVLRISNLLEAMLLPSGNDAAYAVAVYVGRKSLGNPKASRVQAVAEFVRLMNEKAQELGVKNSCFKTPDGYDAIGQYTTAYDMGLIGMAAAENKDILNVVKKSSSRNIFVSGQDMTWYNTNKLISRYSGEFYSPAFGLKTGTSTMAGRCLISGARHNGKKVICVIMNSTSTGRWEDAIALLKYGLK